MANEAIIEQGTFKRRTIVRTPRPHGAGLTAWHIRKFVEALDQADIPDTAVIGNIKDRETMHLVELSAYKDEVMGEDPSG